MEYTNIGYIYVCKHSYEGVNNDFEEAINALYNTDGLIIDFRYNSGGHVDFSLQEGFSILADFTTYTLDKYIRCSSLDLYSLCKQTEIPESSWFIEGDPTTVYNKPIALLVGPHTISIGLNFYQTQGFLVKPHREDFQTIKIFPEWDLK